MAHSGGGARPWTVTLASALTLLGGVLDLALGVLFLVAASSPGSTVGSEVPASADRAILLTLGWLLLAVGVWQAGLGLFLARGSNAARLVLTLVLLGRQATGWYLVGESGERSREGVLTLVVALLTLFLVWNPTASSYFDRRSQRSLSGTLHSRARGSTPTSAILDIVVRLAVLGATIALIPGTHADSAVSVLLALAMIAVVGWALRPVFLRVALVFGWLGAALLAFFANAAVLWLGLSLTPGVSVDGPWTAFVASWVYALLMTLVTWAFSVNTRDYLTVHATQMALRGGRPERSDVPGVIFVQLDGVPAPLLENEIRAGNLPTISRWVRSGSHTWTEWTARVPSTTPVSQAGLLHGATDGIPAFRWYERATGRLLVANRPADAAVIESRISSGHGLLADDGVSISNLFSGDAPVSLLTMSGMKERSRGLGPSSSYAAFFTHPAGILRSVLLTVGEMVKEVFQARRQARRDIQPRIHRSGSYVALRAVTNVFLRDLNVALVVEAMMRGAKSVYVDFVDYDEIAHHAGVTRAESLAALYGLDEALASLESVAGSGIAPRPYHFVLVSDHGQSQGATFRQRYGQSLEDLVRECMGGAVVEAATEEVEGWGPVNVFLGQLASQDSVASRVAQRALRGRDPEAPLGPAGATSPDEGTAAELAVVGSGNLGGVWFTRHEDRLLLGDLESLHPGLVRTLATHPGVGFVVVMTSEGPIAIGRDGSTDLTTGVVVGEDPLDGFGPDAREDFLRVASFADAPDIYLNSLYDPTLDEVAAFEELVGCHGGLGGWQTRPLLVYPAEWSLDADLLDERGRLRGAETVHRQLVRWLERIGHRADLTVNPG